MILVLSYLIAQGVCYLSLCEASFPKKLAFAYLEDLHNEFYDQYGRKVPTVTRPYSFIEFGKTGCDLFGAHCLCRKNKNLDCFLHALFQTHTSRKQRRHTLTAEPGGTWAVLTRSYRMSRELWWQILRKFCKEEKLFLVCTGIIIIIKISPGKGSIKKHKGQNVKNTW